MSICGRLNYSLYGTCRASSTWQKCYTECLVKSGFDVGVANATTFHECFLACVKDHRCEKRLVERTQRWPPSSDDIF